MPDLASAQRALIGRGAMPAIMLSLIAVVSAVSSLNLAAPSIAADLRATQTQIAWIVDSYALVFAALLLLAGAIGDRYGRRLALLAGLSGFAVGAIIAMAAEGSSCSSDRSSPRLGPSPRWQAAPDAST